MLSTFRLSIPKSVNAIPKRSAGHSKWQNIRHIKGAKDTAKSIQFTKIGRQIKVAVQEGGSTDPKFNIKLEHMIEQARRINMPVATVQSLIKAATTDKLKCIQHTFDLKGPGNCMILCEVYTDNLHHTKQSIATAIKKYSCKFANGSAKHMFVQKGIIEADVGDVGLEKATDDAIEAGAEDVKLTDDVFVFICDPNLLRPVTRGLEALNYRVSSSSVEVTPAVLQNLTDDDVNIYAAMFEKLMAIPDVVKVTDNIA